MFDHVVFGVTDYGVSKSFFLKALAPLGVVVASEGPLGIELCRPATTFPSAFGSSRRKSLRTFTWPSKPRVERKSTPSTARRSRQAAETTERPVCGLGTTPTTMRRLSLVRMATTSRWSAMRQPRSEARAA